MPKRSRTRRPAAPVQHHPYEPNPDVPADQDGNQWCRCGAKKTNARHDLPDAPPAHLAQQRRYDPSEGQ
jgi:hypothetical protein